MDQVDDTDAEQQRDGTARGRTRLATLSRRTLRRAWEDDIGAEAAEAAFWSTLSLPPLLLGVLGSIGFVGGWFGPEVVAEVQAQILAFCAHVFSPTLVEEIIAPTVTDILTQGRGGIVSLGFLTSLWAGSSAMASYIDAVTVAYQQYDVRNPVWQRMVALLLYVAGLFMAMITLPVLALGPDLLISLLPDSWQPGINRLGDWMYYPIAGLLLTLTITTLYKVALPRKPPWHRGLPGAVLAVVVFLAAGVVLRRYIAWVSDTGYSYGALSAPIAFLLFTFFLGFAIVLGAHVNAGIDELWPPPPTHRERQRRRQEQFDRVTTRLRLERGRQAWRRRHRVPGPWEMEQATSRQGESGDRAPGAGGSATAVSGDTSDRVEAGRTAGPLGTVPAEETSLDAVPTQAAPASTDVIAARAAVADPVDTEPSVADGTTEPGSTTATRRVDPGDRAP
ncbi:MULTISPECIES: YihY/virulence factor BrkB family protein [Actinoalloteichus]|uniref:Membrane protein n=1 Tax=Actinoalloteichus fjordicus TaxID=1612552 RepID=A0AAC9PR07_9PSEU|nr:MULTISPECIES: YihY/virulence factor BrkB family protein [Actinoalloteichus]APU13744.1 putative membrane protein [Actinoalloteichus fjordicus]APU19689.1 putative membrane protein [Actinoalloteichus sp. GBA129-24]